MEGKGAEWRGREGEEDVCIAGRISVGSKVSASENRNAIT